MPRFPSAQGRLNHDPGFHLSCDENLSEGWGPPLLRKVHVNLMLAAHPADALAVYYGEAKFRGKNAINTACRRASVDKGPDIYLAWSRRAVCLDQEVLVKPDVHTDGWTVPR